MADRHMSALQAERAALWPPDDTEESVLGTNLHQTTITNTRLGINEIAAGLAAPGQPIPWQALSQTMLSGLQRYDGSSYTVLPDVFVYLRAIDPRRASVTLAREGPPVLVIEVASESTFTGDVDVERGKGWSYAYGGVREYMVLDPTGEFVPEGVRAWRLIGGVYRPWQAEADGRWHSREIAATLALEGAQVAIYRLDGRRMPREGETARELARAEQAHAEELARGAGACRRVGTRGAGACRGIGPERCGTRGLTSPARTARRRRIAARTPERVATYRLPRHHTERCSDRHGDGCEPRRVYGEDERTMSTNAPVTATAAGTIALGGTLSVNRMGFGAMRLTGNGIWGDPVDRDECKAVLRRAIELGITLIDTADSYGPEVSENLIAEALYPYPQGLVIATKGGQQRPGPGQWTPDGRPAHLRAACEGSLRRLKVDHIDLYQLHRPDPNVPFEESVGALAALQREGKIRHIGISNVSVDQLEQAGRIVQVVSLQNRYSISDRSSEAVLRACAREGIAFLPWAPIEAGRLTEPGGPLDQAAERHGATQGQIALAWLLQHSPVMLPIPGTSKVAHLEENIAAAATRLSDEELTTLEK